MFCRALKHALSQSITCAGNHTAALHSRHAFPDLEFSNDELAQQAWRMSADIVDLDEHRRVRQMADTLAGLAVDRPGDLIVLQHLMADNPGLATELVRRVFAGDASLGRAAAIARRWYTCG
ncbi:MAG: hypothetical protein IT493_02980 [Gammaproteobacteria bacterium]|nr:hypothetical protein [Gammaproteobacteria bacterium]